MTIKITTDVFCDYCPNWVHGFIASRPMSRQARRLARGMDWRARWGRGRSLLDICPQCQEKEREQGKTK